MQDQDQAGREQDWEKTSSAAAPKQVSFPGFFRKHQKVSWKRCYNSSKTQTVQNKFFNYGPSDCELATPSLINTSQTQLAQERGRRNEFWSLPALPRADVSRWSVPASVNGKEESEKLEQKVEEGRRRKSVFRLQLWFSSKQ